MLAISYFIFIGAILLVLSILTSVISFRIGAPLLLVFLGVGLLAGVDGPGGIQFNDAGGAFLIGSIALALILFDSGFNTRFTSFRAAMMPAVTLATMGVALTAGFLGIAAHYLVGLSWLESLLVGAIIGSTDAAAVFFLLRTGGITLRERPRHTLEIESGSNDPIAVFLTILLAEMILGGEPVSAAAAAGDFLIQIGGGAVCGLIGGGVIVLATTRLQLDRGLYPVLTLALSLLVFGTTSVLGASGFLAAYVAGLMAGNAGIRNATSLRRFHSGLTWLAQIVMFIMLGLLATPSEFSPVVLPALVLTVVLIFIARPLAIWLCLLPFNYTRNEQTFVAWVGLRGAVSVLLATVPIFLGLPNGQPIFNMIFVMVVASLLVQGWTIRPMARWLGLVVPPRLGPVDRIELELPHETGYELIVYTVRENSPVAKGQRVPRWARPSFIVRGGRSYSVHNVRRFEPGDHLYIFMRPRYVELLDHLLGSPRELTDEDTAYFGDLVLRPDTTLQTLSEMYGLPLSIDRADMTLTELFQQELGGELDRGDRTLYGGLELIVREVENGQAKSIGLSLERGRFSEPRLPFFQRPHEIRAALASGWRRLRRFWRQRRRQFTRRKSPAPGA